MPFCLKTKILASLDFFKAYMRSVIKTYALTPWPSRSDMLYTYALNRLNQHKVYVTMELKVILSIKFSVKINIVLIEFFASLEQPISRFQFVKISYMFSES